MFAIRKVAAVFFMLLIAVDVVEIIDAASTVYEETTCEDIGAPYYIQMNHVGNNIVIMWIPPKVSAGCSLEFQILFYVNDEFFRKETTKRTYYVVSEGIPTCSKLKTEISTISDSGSESDFISAEILTIFDSISGISIDSTSTLVSWTMKSGPTKCKFRVEVNSEVVEEALNKLSYNGLIPCESYNVSITPINFDGAIGTRSTINYYNTGLGSPHHVQMLQIDKKMVITWTPPQNMSRFCDVKYEILFFIDDIFQMSDVTKSTNYIYDKALVSCSRFSIKIRTITNTGSGSAWISVKTDTRIDDISHITVENDAISWSMNSGPTNCKFRIEVDDEIVAYSVDELSYNLENLYPCKISKISVTPIDFNENHGTTYTRYYEPAPLTLKKFRVEEQPVGKVTAKWEALNGNCKIKITTHNQYGNFISTEEADASVGLLVLDSNKYEGCVSYVMHVRFSLSSYDDSSKVRATSIFQRQPTLMNFRVEEEPTDNIKAVWEPLTGTCRIGIIIYDSVGAPVKSEETDASTGSLYLDKNALDYCSSYDVQAQLSSATGNSSIGETTFTSFYKRPSPLVSFRIHQDPTGTITAKWNNLRGNCKIRITRSEDDEESTILGLADASAGSMDLLSDDFDYCIFYNISIRFLDTDGNVTTDEASTYTFQILPLVLEDFRVEEELDGTITAKWTALTNNCRIAITRTNSRLQPIIYGTAEASAGFIVIDNNSFDYCKTYIVQAQFSFNNDNNLAGVVADTLFQRPITPVEEFRIDENSETGDIIATWKPLKGICEILITDLNSDGEFIDVTDATKGSLLLKRDYFNYCKSYVMQAHFPVPGDVEHKGDASFFEFRKYLQPIKELDIALVNRNVEISWTLIHNDMSKCLFEREFNFDCSTNLVSGGGRLTKDNSHKFTDCPIDKNVMRFSMKIIPILTEASEFEASPIYCEYTVFPGNTYFDLEENSGSSSVCPLYVTEYNI